MKNQSLATAMLNHVRTTPASESVHKQRREASSISNFKRLNGRKPACGFTLIELLVVIAIIAILAAMLLSVLANAKKTAQGIKCMSNQRQVMMAVLMYVNDNNNYFPLNKTGSPSNNWVNAHMDYTGGTDDTNWAKLVDPNQSQLALYIQTPGVYRCPADQSKNNGLTGLPRVRSYSMSEAIGVQDLNGTPLATTSGDLDLNTTIYTVYTKDAQMRGALGPSDIFVLIDEHPDSIDDGVYAVKMSQWYFGNFINSEVGFINWPAKWHNNSCGFAFADGHSEIHRWQLPGIIPDPTYNTFMGTTFERDNDALWLFHHTSVPLNPNAGMF
jgi:prepilin-type N-terminal cleavage/methylation domain-containing protein/prepilin-type processing-associated H-X9-DG protein